MDFCEGLAPVLKDGLWGFVNTEGGEVIPCQYKAVKYFKGGYSPVIKELCGIIDKQGNEIIPCQYEGVYNFRGDYALVKQGGLWGVANKKAEIVIPCNYKDEALDDSYFEDVYQISNEWLKKQMNNLMKGKVE
jgi:hypothetical protein